LTSTTPLRYSEDTQLANFKLTTSSIAFDRADLYAFQVSWSFRAQRLAQEPDSDDNAHLFYAIQRLEFLGNEFFHS
jgi:hypothetical protein